MPGHPVTLLPATTAWDLSSKKSCARHRKEKPSIGKGHGAPPKPLIPISSFVSFFLKCLSEQVWGSSLCLSEDLFGQCQSVGLDLFIKKGDHALRQNGCGVVNEHRLSLFNRYYNQIWSHKTMGDHLKIEEYTRKSSTCRKHTQMYDLNSWKGHM